MSPRVILYVTSTRFIVLTLTMSCPGLEGSLTCGTGTGNFGVHRLQMESTSKSETCQWVAKPELTFEADTIFLHTANLHLRLWHQLWPRFCGNFEGIHGF